MLQIFKFTLLVASLALPPGMFGDSPDSRKLVFYHTHSGKTLEVVYFREGNYDPKAMAKLKIFLADWRDGQQHDIDPQLLDILWKIQQTTGNSGIWEVISAYRSASTNKMLRSKSKGVAQHSQHLLGKAIDVRLKGLDLESLHQTAKYLELGGVGFYAGPDFVHIDTGRVRHW